MRTGRDINTEIRDRKSKSKKNIKKKETDKIKLFKKVRSNRQPIQVRVGAPP